MESWRKPSYPYAINIKIFKISSNPNLFGHNLISPHPSEQSSKRLNKTPTTAHTTAHNNLKPQTNVLTMTIRA